MCGASTGFEHFGIHEQNPDCPKNLFGINFHQHWCNFNRNIKKFNYNTKTGTSYTSYWYEEQQYWHTQH